MKKEIKGKKKGIFFKFSVLIVRLFYRKRVFIGEKNLPKESCIIVGNHAQVHGPLACQLFFPTYKYIWCIGEMMNIKEVPAYAYKDFWSYKPKSVRWIFRILSYLIAPVASYYLSRADTIAVYKDTRLLSTYRETMEKLDDGANIVIFPEKVDDFNEIVNEFQDKFIDVAKLYYKKTGREIYFVPMYNASTLHKIVFGNPIKYDCNMDIKDQRKNICDYLKKEITRLAKELPVHTVIPYKNISKKKYVKSK